MSFRHGYHIASACGTPEYTNYVGKFRGCLDYIFYMPDLMHVRQVSAAESHSARFRGSCWGLMCVGVSGHFSSFVTLC